MRFISLAILWLAYAHFAMAQLAEELASLPKDTLINRALAKIPDRSFDASDFDSIEVWMEGQDLTVEFNHALRFIPRKGQYYYAAAVNLVTGSPVLYIEGNGPSKEKVYFYKPSKYKKEIQFVIDAINKSDEVGGIPDGKRPDGSMTIQEKLSYYDIAVDSKSTHSSYKFKKGSGKIYDVSHKHYAYSETSRTKIE